MQLILTYIIIALAVGFTGWKVYQAIKRHCRGGGGCGCGCGGRKKSCLK